MLPHTNSRPDRYTSSQRSSDSFRLAVRSPLGFVALIWLIQILNWGLDLRPADFGVRPRQIVGLAGILRSSCTATSATSSPIRCRC
jgi:hypothetical protein